MSAADSRSFAVGVLAPSGSDGQLAVRVLGKSGIQAVAFWEMPSLCTAIEAGLGAVLIAEEGLVRAPRHALEATLATQPAWSVLPVVVLLS